MRDKIIADHPLLYRKTSYLEIGDGWLPLVYELSSKIEPIIQQMNAEVQEECFVAQVKEKYAELRFYMSSSTKEIDDIIAHYEEVAQKTCEYCGGPGKLDKRTSWLSIRCEKCE